MLIFLVIYLTSLVCYISPKFHSEIKIGASSTVGDCFLCVSYDGELMFIPGMFATLGYTVGQHCWR